jgi:hypothetical protein
MGQLGDGTIQGRPTPTPPLMGLDFTVGVAAGHDHACTLGSGGTVHCWGSNLSGQLGISGIQSARVPLALQPSPNAMGLAAGARHNCALMTDETVRCWGSNEQGGLGDGTTADSSTPVPVRFRGFGAGGRGGGGSGGSSGTGGVGGPGAGNLIVNGDFTSGGDHWLFQDHTGVGALISTSGGEYCIQPNGTSITLGWPATPAEGARLEPGAAYRFGFRARALYSLPIDVKVGEVSPPYSSIFTVNQLIETFPVTFSYGLVAPTTSTPVGVAFNVIISTNNFICFDDVVLSRM